jgi:hypothetical protein
MQQHSENVHELAPEITRRKDRSGRCPRWSRQAARLDPLPQSHELRNIRTCPEDTGIQPASRCPATAVIPGERVPVLRNVEQISCRRCRLEDHGRGRVPKSRPRKMGVACESWGLSLHRRLRHLATSDAASEAFGLFSDFAWLISNQAVVGSQRSSQSESR